MDNDKNLSSIIYLLEENGYSNININLENSYIFNAEKDFLPFLICILDEPPTKLPRNVLPNGVKVARAAELLKDEENGLYASVYPIPDGTTRISELSNRENKSFEFNVYKKICLTNRSLKKRSIYLNDIQYQLMTADRWENVYLLDCGFQTEPNEGRELKFRQDFGFIGEISYGNTSMPIYGSRENYGQLINCELLPQGRPLCKVIYIEGREFPSLWNISDDNWYPEIEGEITLKSDKYIKPNGTISLKREFSFTAGDEEKKYRVRLL